MTTRNRTLARPKWRLIEPDPRPGQYYVTAIDGPKTAFLAGPFRYHSDALARIEAANTRMFEAYPIQAPWVAIGTSHFEGRGAPRALFGMLEDR